METSYSDQSQAFLCTRWPSIMHPLKEYFRITAELIHLLDDRNRIDRDKRLVIIDEKLNEREELKKAIQPPFSEADEELGKQSVLLDKKLMMLLQKEKNSIQQDLANTKKKKKVQSGYINPYASLQTDGYFYDKKK